MRRPDILLFLTDGWQYCLSHWSLGRLVPQSFLSLCLSLSEVHSLNLQESFLLKSSGLENSINPQSAKGSPEPRAAVYSDTWGDGSGSESRFPGSGFGQGPGRLMAGMAPHSSTFAWKIPWMEEPGGLQSMGSLESDPTERLPFHFLLSCIGEGNGNPLQCSCLENPRDGGAWWAAVYGLAQSQTRLKRLSSSSGKMLSSILDHQGSRYGEEVVVRLTPRNCMKIDRASMKRDVW